jgi:hypothetical protein
MIRFNPRARLGSHSGQQLDHLPIGSPIAFMPIGQRDSGRQFPAPATLQAHNGLGNVQLGIPGVQAINLHLHRQPAGRPQSAAPLP